MGPPFTVLSCLVRQYGLLGRQEYKSIWPARAVGEYDRTCCKSVLANGWRHEVVVEVFWTTVGGANAAAVYFEGRTLFSLRGGRCLS